MHLGGGENAPFTIDELRMALDKTGKLHQGKTKSVILRLNI